MPRGRARAASAGARRRGGPWRCRGRRRRRACGRLSSRVAESAPNPSRSSSRGWVVSGSSRQITTTRERSRISPSVAVEAPRNGTAGAPGHVPAKPSVATSAPSRSASATAALASSTVAPDRSRARAAAAPRAAARPPGPPPSRRRPARPLDRRRRRALRARTCSENHSAPRSHRGCKRRSSPERSIEHVVAQSAHPAHVTGPSSVTGRHGVGERGQQPRAKCRNLRRALHRRDQRANRLAPS